MIREDGRGRPCQLLGANLPPGLWLRLTVLLIIVGSYLMTVVVNDRREHTLILKDIDRLSSVTTTSATTHTEVIFAKTIDLLAALRFDLAKGDTRTQGAQEILEDHFFGAPELRTTLMLDTDGRIVASSVPAFIGNDASFHPFFKAHLYPDRDQPFTGNIIVGNTTRAPHLFSSLRLADSAGNFAGVVAAAYELTYLRDLYRRLVPGSSFTIGLFHTEEGLIVASDSEIRPGQLPLSSRFPANVPSDGSGHWGSIKILVENGEDALMTTQTVNAGAFFVSTMANVNELLSQYRENRLIKFALAAVFVCTAMVLAISLEIYMFRRRRAEADKAALEITLRHAQKMEALGTLAGGLAHDFNNFLSSIIGFGEIAKERIEDRPSLEGAIDHILIAGRRAEALVNQILAFSRRTAPTRERVRLADILREVVELMQTSIHPALVVSLDLQHGDLWTMGDAGQLDQVVMNLCSNSVQAMPDGGTLRIVLEAVDIEEKGPPRPAGIEAGRYASITVADTGCGMSSEVRERIFEPFFTTKEIGRGTGLGLSIAHGIVIATGGTISVNSRPGEGTVVDVLLPLCPPRTETMHTDVDSVPEGAGRCVMVVDDEDSIVSFMEDRLACLGFEPVGHTSACEALEAFELSPDRFDLVITDFAMPEMDGIALVQDLRRWRSDVSVILITGYNTVEVRERAREQDIEVILGKPLSSEKLASAIAEVLRDPLPAT